MLGCYDRFQQLQTAERPLFSSLNYPIQPNSINASAFLHSKRRSTPNKSQGISYTIIQSTFISLFIIILWAQLNVQLPVQPASALAAAYTVLTTGTILVLPPPSPSGDSDAKVVFEYTALADNTNTFTFSSAAATCGLLGLGWGIAPIPSSDVQILVQGTGQQLWIAAALQEGTGISSAGSWRWVGTNRWTGILFSQGSQCQSGSYCNWEVTAPNSASATDTSARVTLTGKWDDMTASSVMGYGVVCHRSPCHVELDCQNKMFDDPRFVKYIPYIYDAEGYYPYCTCYSNRPWLGPGSAPSAIVSDTNIIFAAKTLTAIPPVTITSVLTGTENSASLSESTSTSVSHSHSVSQFSPSGSTTATFTPSRSAVSSTSRSQSPIQPRKSRTSSPDLSGSISPRGTSTVTATGSPSSTGLPNQSVTNPHTDSRSASTEQTATRPTSVFTMSNQPDSNTRTQHTTSQSIVIPPPKIIRGVPAEVRQKAELAAGAVSVVGGMGAGPTASQIGVAMAMSRMAKCASSEDTADTKDESLSLLVHPLMFGVGTGDLSYERGAVIGNCLIIPFVFCFVMRLVLANVIAKAEGSTVGISSTSPQALLTIGWPSVMVVPFVALGEGCGYAITSLLLDPAAQPENIVLGLFGLGVCVTAVVLWLVALRRWMPSVAFSPSDKASGALMWSLTARATWEPVTHVGVSYKKDKVLAVLDEELDSVAASYPRNAQAAISNHLRLSHCIGDRRFRYAEWVSFACNLAIGVLEGVPDDFNADIWCKSRVLLAFCLVVVVALTAMAATVPAEFATSGIMNVFLTILTAFTLVTVFGGSRSDLVSNDLVASVGAATNLVGLAIMPLGLAEGLLRVAWRRKLAIRLSRRRTLQPRPKPQDPNQDDVHVPLTLLVEPLREPTTEIVRPNADDSSIDLALLNPLDSPEVVSTNIPQDGLLLYQGMPMPAQWVTILMEVDQMEEDKFQNQKSVSL